MINMGIGNFRELDEPETNTSADVEAGEQYDDMGSEKLNTENNMNMPERPQESKDDGSEKLDSPGSDNDYSYKHLDEGERSKGDFSFKHSDEDERPKGDFSFKHPDESKKPEGDFSYKPENNFNRENYEDDDPGEKSPYTRKLTR